MSVVPMNLRPITNACSWFRSPEPNSLYIVLILNTGNLRRGDTDQRVASFHDEMVQLAYSEPGTYVVGRCRSARAVVQSRV